MEPMEKCSTLIYLVDNRCSFSPEITLSEDFFADGENMLNQLLDEIEIPVSSGLIKRTLNAVKTCS